MACCTGSEIDLKEMRTPGQKEMGDILGPLFQAGISQGATPFGGQLSMGPDQAQMAAMNTMMGIGGQGGYQPGGYPTMAPQGGPPGPNVSPRDPYSSIPPRPPGLGYGDGGENDIIPPGRRSPFADPFDPRYLPGGERPPYPYSTYDPTSGFPIKGGEKGGHPR